MQIFRTPLALNVALGIVALLGAGWAYQMITASSTTTPTTPTGARTVAVTQGVVTSSASASGSVQSANTASADFVTSGTVISIAVKVGDTVAVGQELARVDPTDSQATLNTANSNLSAAKASLTRAKTGGDDATIATAQAQVTTATATVDAANRAVAGTILKAPMAGTVTAITGSVGGSASGTGSSSGSSSSGGSGGQTGGSSSSSSSSSTSSGFIQLADLTKMQVTASFAEADATKLKAGQTATVTWAALSGATASAKVATIAPTATTTNSVNSYAVVVSLDELPDGTRIGQTVTVQVIVAQAENVIRVPSAAVRTTNNRHTVTVVANGQSTPRTVEVGILGDTFTQITSGLTAGEQVTIVVATTNSTTGTNGRNGTGGLGGVGGFGGGGVGGAGAGGAGGGR
jgi:macrolide-specific efflux system membrane fusion protein